VANERKTEDLVEKRLRARGYYDEHSGTVVEKQRSDVPRIGALLKTASKAGTEHPGNPEFIIHSPSCPDFVIVIECKASTLRHESSNRDQPAQYAVDGALHYSGFLARDFDVLAIAVSGETEARLRTSHFLHLRGTRAAFAWEDVSDFVSILDYYRAFISTDAKFRQDYEVLLDFSRRLNNELQSRKITESERGFLISGILIALQNEAFRRSYKARKTAREIAKSVLDTIRSEFESVELPQFRQDVLRQSFSFITVSPPLTQDRDFILTLINAIDDNINSFMRTHKYYDIIGQFYIEFLRYANNDKGLGIVLTPYHIAQLFAEIADVRPDSVVLDNCCGTAGLLIAAMRRMVRDAGLDEEAQARIKAEQLIGLEYQPKIYALAVSNMILHGDGKTNIHRGDCFTELPGLIQGHGLPTVGLLNPPYKNKQVKGDREELDFVLNNLDSLAPGGTCVAIVPITCATAPSGVIADWKRAIMKRHTLEAVMSMPIELFHNSKTTVVTCIMVFTAGRPHPRGKKSWFGYWRDDGYIKTKHRGRIDPSGSWSEIMKHWVNSFRNRDVIPGESIMREVTHAHEWCAEAYLDANYGAIGPELLTQMAKKFLLARLMQKNGIAVEEKWRSE